ncbi:MFS transporter [Amnibacterium kyonggiense]|uniref:Putative MFS family arabinose efflux permease n=1 Tax=Amnibacterium kyonggiense TaxID=595671 RepID=A0A4R7FS00_9MICO|nr:MFS transporter [Amnibacterium kyonggiense]TDS80518.1 putative MFS family arabinose efflux permease [Amnibacterium kyonggiense]
MPEQRTAYREVFASRGYPAIYAGATLTMVAASLQVLAFSVAVYDTTRSPAWSSIAFAAGFLPQVVGGAVLPSLADRIPPRVLLPIGALIRLAAAALLASGVLGLGGGLAVVAAAALLQPLFSTGQSVLVSRLLDGDRYVLGRSLFTITSMLSQLVGIAIGGATLQALGPAPALLVAAALQGVAAVVLAVGLPSLPVLRAERERWHPAETLRGYRSVLRVRLLRDLLLLWWVPLGLFVGAESLAVAYAGAQHASGLLTALLIAGPPAGALIGELVIGRLCLPSTRERLVLPLLLLTGAPLLLLALTPPPVIATLLLFAASVGLAYELGRQGAFRDALPQGRQASGFGLLSVGMMTFQGVGPLLAGSLGSLLGPGAAMAVCGALVLGSALLLRRVATDRLPRAAEVDTVGA